MGQDNSFTAQEWAELKRRYNYTCLRCGRREPEIKLTADHVVPISKGGARLTIFSRYADLATRPSTTILSTTGKTGNNVDLAPTEHLCLIDYTMRQTLVCGGANSR